jgi:hypothetical protein
MSYVKSGTANITFYNGTSFYQFEQRVPLNIASGSASDMDVITVVSFTAQFAEPVPANTLIAMYPSGSISPLLSGTIPAGERTISLSASASQLSAAGLQGGTLWKYAYLSVIPQTVPTSPTNVTIQMSATLNVTSTTGTVPAGTTGDRFAVRTQPPSTIAPNTQFTINIDVVDSNGHRDAGYEGWAYVSMYYTDEAIAKSGWLAAEPKVIFYSLHIEDGTASVTVSILPAHANHDVYWKIEPEGVGYTTPQKTTTHTCHVTGTGGGPSWHLSFATQPQLINTLGDTIPAVSVEILDANGNVDPTFLDYVQLQVNKADGKTPADTGSLSGTTFVKLSGGVATFDTLKVLKPGGYTLRATHSLARSTTSNVFYGVGTDVLASSTALRQNIRNDNTAWQKTTGTSNPTFATPSSTELNNVNGDLASTNKVTVDGFRMTFPFYMVLTKVIIKAKVSSVTAGPYWQLYTSDDTTTPTNGTWKVRKSYTPPNTNITTVTWTFPTTTVTKGLWVTQNKNGGSSTCDWYSIQVFGHYMNSDIQFFDVTTHQPVVEEYIGVPNPFKTLSGAQTVSRTLLVKNNTSATKQLQLQLEPIRSGGDTRADADNAVLLDESGKVLDYPLIVPADGFGTFQVKYTIAAADNDNSGKHYMRINAYEWEETTGWIGTIWTGTNQFVLKGIVSGSNVGAVGGTNVTDCAYDVAHRSLLSLWIGTGGLNTSLFVDCSTPTGAGPLPWSQITGVTPNTGFTRLAFRDDNILLTRNDSTTCYVFSKVYSLSGSQPLSTASTFTLPTAATGDKIAVGSDTGYFHILNGTSGSVRLYRSTTSGAIAGNVSLSSWLGSGTITGMWYDAINRLIFLVTAVSGGTRKIAWYNSTTLQQVGTATNADRNTFDCYGGFTQGTSYYLFFGARYLWRYASTSYSGGTEIKDFAPSSPSTKGPAYSVI